MKYTEAEVRKLRKFEWSMGNGQCPYCEGLKPNARWWTRTIGHKKDCVLAMLIENSGFEVEYEQLNPERDVGSYSVDGHLIFIRDNDPDKEAKLELGRKQWEEKGFI